MRRCAWWIVVACLLASIAGCATVGSDNWTATPADEPPERSELAAWDVYWDDKKRFWRDNGEGHRVDGSEVPVDGWTYEQDAIALRVSAAERLNYSRGASHTVAVHAIQAKEPGDLMDRLRFPTEVYRLVRRGTDDPDVLAMEREIIEPGRETLIRIDRAERARYLLLVVGYTDYARSGATRMIPIPGVREIPRGRERLVPGNLVDAVNPFSSTPAPRPARLEGWLALGEEEVTQLQMVAR